MTDAAPGFAQQIEALFTARLATVRASGKLQLPDRLLAAVFDTADEVAREVADRGEPAAPPACVRSCTYCCYRSFEISGPEARALAHYLSQRLHPDNALTLAGVLVDFEEATRGLTRAARFRGEMPCPLLDEGTGMCLVYPVRPLSCRGTHSLAVGSCERSCGEDGVTIETNVELDEVYRAATRALLRACGEAGVPAETSPFPQALREALEALF